MLTINHCFDLYSRYKTVAIRPLTGKPGVIVLIAMLVSLAYSDAAIAERQSLTSILLQAESFLAKQEYNSPYAARFEFSSLDSRLNLKPCAQALDIKFTRSDRFMGNTSISIRCKSPVSWQIHLPVRIDVYDDIAVNASTLIKGQSLDVNRVSYRKKKISSLQRGYFRKSDSLTRLRVKRGLASGTILNPANVEPALMIKSGQKVTIVLSMDGLDIKSSGTALQSARMGDTIKVKNTQSNRIIEGTVSSEGVIRVRL